MKSNQKHTPKYWVGHDPREDDVYIDTARKSREDTYEAFNKLLNGKYEELYEEGKVGIILISIDKAKT